jgi:hypothetical protein
MKRVALLSAAICIGALSSAATACLNDRDTLAQEARGLPDALQVVTGRFERNPPLFYEMRLKRVATQLKGDPSQLELYDDAAVASDRLGRSDEAIRWIELKRKQLAPFNAKDKMLREHWYRYYANGGTSGCLHSRQKTWHFPYVPSHGH